MVGQGVCCSVCDSANKAALVCPACINNTLLFERRKMLVELSERRAALLQNLDAVVAQRQGHVDLEVRRQQLAAAAVLSRERVLRAERLLEEAKREAARLRASNAARRCSHDVATSELAARRSEHLAHHPTLLRYQALTHSHVAAMLLAEQRSKLGLLLDTLPLRVAAIRSAMLQGRAAPEGAAGGAAASAGSGGSGSGGAGASPIQVTICNLKLPDGPSVSSLMVQQPESTSSALGYLLLLGELLATYLGGPLLHEGSFQGSTSVVWQQHSFWNRRPSSSNARLPLFLEEGGGAGPGISNPFPGLAAKVRGPSTWGSPHPSQQQPHQAQQQGPGGAAASAFSALTRALSGNPSGGGGGGGGGGGAAHSQLVDEALLRQRHTDLRLAYDMLLRSLACFTRDKVLPLGLQLPPGWGPFGWLAVLCATVRRDPGTEAVLGAAQQALLAGHGSGDLRVGGGGGEGDGGGGHDNDDDEACDVEEDGWDVVQAPFLPPPPSQPDEVEHWTRAMFTDAHSAYGAAAASRRPGLGLAGQAGPPAMSIERVRSIFSK